jgi:flavin-dependent dehydrogenase
VRIPLRELGVWEQFLADRHLESPGVAAAWGHAHLYDNDYVVNPHGAGWHVDRRRFDAMLAQSAEAAGVELLKGARPNACGADSSARWSVTALGREGPLVRHAAFLIDATGRSASPARRLGGGREVHDRLVAVVGVAHGEHNTDRRTMIEATAGGWWYSAPLPDGRCVAAFMTDADLLPRLAADRARFWRTELWAAPHTRARLRLGVGEPALRAYSACTSRRMRVAEPGWVAVGEAALCFDPLSQQGVTWALCSGIEAARAVASALRGDSTALNEYARWVAAEFHEYLETRSYYYGLERRWAGSEFWRRRHATERAPDLSS